jgi:hypothetical protein
MGLGGALATREARPALLRAFWAPKARKRLGTYLKYPQDLSKGARGRVKRGGWEVTLRGTLRGRGGGALRVRAAGGRVPCRRCGRGRGSAEAPPARRAVRSRGRRMSEGGASLLCWVNATLSRGSVSHACARAGAGAPGRQGPRPAWACGAAKRLRDGVLAMWAWALELQVLGGWEAGYRCGGAGCQNSIQAAKAIAFLLRR